jgi:hypothetical protein
MNYFNFKFNDLELILLSVSLYLIELYYDKILKFDLNQKYIIDVI